MSCHQARSVAHVVERRKKEARNHLRNGLKEIRVFQGVQQSEK